MKRCTRVRDRRPDDTNSPWPVSVYKRVERIVDVSYCRAPQPVTLFRIERHEERGEEDGLN